MFPSSLPPLLLSPPLSFLRDLPLTSCDPTWRAPTQCEDAALPQPQPQPRVNQQPPATLLWNPAAATSGQLIKWNANSPTARQGGVAKVANNVMTPCTCNQKTLHITPTLRNHQHVCSWVCFRKGGCCFATGYRDLHQLVCMWRGGFLQ